MIDRYDIDSERGYDNQVGLYVQGEEQAVRQFYWALQQAGFKCVPQKSSNRAEFNHFVFVYAHTEALDKSALTQQLRPICNQHCTHPSSVADASDYDDWQAFFNTYIQAYRKQRFDQLETPPSDVFDKARAYDLIASARYDEAERYLRRFADDAPPALAPIYLVYLYHAWQRSAEVIAVHRRYEGLFRASDLDHRVVAWIAEAYLAEGELDRARAVVDEFLPEFQRQGVAEELLVLRN